MLCSARPSASPSTYSPSMPLRSFRPHMPPMMRASTCTCEPHLAALVVCFSATRCSVPCRGYVAATVIKSVQHGSRSIVWLAPCICTS